MKKRMQLYQMLLGCALCLCIFLSGFLPRTVLKPDRILDGLSDAIVEQGYEYLSLLDGLGLWDEKDTKETKEEIIQAIREKNQFFSQSTVEIPSIAFIFLTKSTLKAQLDDALEEFDEKYKSVLASHIDTEKISEILYSTVEGEMWKIRFFMICTYGFPLVLFVLFMISYVRKWSLLPVEIVGFLSVIMTFFGELYWRIGFREAILSLFRENTSGLADSWAEKLKDYAGKVTKKLPGGSLLNGIFDTTLNSVKESVQDFFEKLEETLKGVLEDSVGSGSTVALILAVLLGIWLIFMIIWKEKKGADGKEHVSNGAVKGQILIENGMMHGASIKIDPSEVISIGSDARQAQLVLGKSLQPCHCRVMLLPNKEQYIVEACMGNCHLTLQQFQVSMSPGQKRYAPGGSLVEFMGINGMAEDRMYLL